MISAELTKFMATRNRQIIHKREVKELTERVESAINYGIQEGAAIGVDVIALEYKKEVLNEVTYMLTLAGYIVEYSESLLSIRWD